MSFQLHRQVAINCILSRGSDGLQGEGCMYDLSTPRQPMASADTLQPGDRIQLHLWIPDEDSHIAINLAEVQWVKPNCIKVDLLTMNPPDQTRLNQFTASQNTLSRSSNAASQVLIWF